MKLGHCKLKAAACIGNRESLHMAYLTNLVNQSSLDISFIRTADISSEVSNTDGESLCSQKHFMGFYKVTVFSSYSIGGTSYR
jgi:hypothetical protein